jgi:hypothetical protein
LSRWRTIGTYATAGALYYLIPAVFSLQYPRSGEPGTYALWDLLHLACLVGAVIAACMFVPAHGVRKGALAGLFTWVAGALWSIVLAVPALLLVGLWSFVLMLTYLGLAIVTVPVALGVGALTGFWLKRRIPSPPPRPVYLG